MIKATIFDFDGLIFDTETPQYEVLQEIFRDHGSELPLSKWQDVIGTSTDFCPYTYLETKIKKSLDKDLLEKEMNKRLSNRLSEMSSRPGVTEYLEQAKSQGLKIGLASSSHYGWVTTHLKNLGLFDNFDCIRTADDVKNVKPDPGLYIETAKCLNVNPKECLVFEDSANGALAAKKAGAACVIVPNPLTKDFEFCEVEGRLASMKDISLRRLLKDLVFKQV